MNTTGKSMKPILILAGVAVVVFGIIFGVITLTRNTGKSKSVISTENAMKTLDKVYGDITINTVTPRKEPVDLEPVDLKASLPEIDTYPVQIHNETDDFVEIFSSPEKAGEGKDGWLVEMAKAFNAADITVDGKPVSVRLRSIASGTGMDYIVSGKYTPDAFTPSNAFWGDILQSKGIPVTLAEKRMAGNVPGILLTKEKQQQLIQEYGSVNLKNIAEAVVNSEMSLGYTNPFSSSTGLNLLLSTLSTFDVNNPVSDKAVAEFEKFQANIPYVAYTTLQMRESAKSGALDGFVTEYQLYENTPELKSDYIFTPFGVRHDNPMYEVGTLSATKKQILRQFIDYCLKDENQAVATKYGFNQLDDYKAEIGDVKGDIILQAQQLWKEKKGGGTHTVAVFVADISGSMEGDRLNKLKESLLSGSKYISEENAIGLVTFSDEVNINLPIAPFNINQRSLFTGAVMDMRATGGTAMFDGITVATKMLMDEKAKDPTIKPMLFVLSDGETNTGHSLKSIQEMVKSLKIPIYTIGYEANIKVLENLSNLNEAASINADTEDVVYKLQNLFNAQM